jgi:hypothetical protein
MLVCKLVLDIIRSVLKVKKMEEEEEEKKIEEEENIGLYLVYPAGIGL